MPTAKTRCLLHVTYVRWVFLTHIESETLPKVTISPTLFNQTNYWGV